jgi:hypothetical protein
VSGWLPGALITDVHPIEAGARLEVGLNDPATDERFGRRF